MQTRIDFASRADPRIAEAEAILRSCVHCGFCNATCPTYQLLGSEPDGPRGRIYLVKNMLEEGVAGERTRLHLDRCLTCRSCETTCPSGVKYARLIDIGRAIVEEKVRRPFIDRARRFAMLAVLPHPGRLNLALKFARIAKPFLSSHLKRKIFPRRIAAAFPPARHKRKMLVLEGCVQPLASPNTNFAASRVLDRVGISLVPVSGCCGAMHQHMGKEEAAREVMRRNIDLWW
ncbi:MAG: glycolate oxidase subunit GlcF, partial [Burkholderiales bacterium]